MHAISNTQLSHKVDGDSKNDSDTAPFPNEQQQQGDDLPYSAEDDTYQIDQKTLPYIFRFNYAALQKLRLSRAPGVPPIAQDIFYYLRDKLIVRRYSEGSRYPNRMKYQQKVKFVMRAFDHSFSLMHNTPVNSRNQHYNKQKQVQFFGRPDVQRNFVEEIKKALVRKKAQNERRVMQLERYIQTALEHGFKQPAIATQIFRNKIQRRQLPWTDNMFKDISEFSRLLYVRYTRPKPMEQKRILQMELGQDGQWQMVEKMEWKELQHQKKQTLQNLLKEQNSDKQDLSSQKYYNLDSKDQP